MNVAFTLDDAPVALDCAPERRLIDILREDLGATAPKQGCGVGRCGACLVLLDDRPVNACLVPAARLEGAAVVTAAGLGAAAEPIRQALAKTGAVQCGYCASGLVTLLTWLAAPGRSTTRAEAEQLLSGQICRCTGYGGLRRAIALLFDRPPA